MICDSEQTTSNYHGNTGHTCTHTHYLPIILLKIKDDDFDVEKIEIEREKGGKEKEMEHKNTLYKQFHSLFLKNM